MALNKYKGFLPGEKLPAENVNSIDPENITPQSAGYLVGGTGHSALSVFQALGAGANDGKFKINVDGAVFDNIPVDFFSELEAETSISSYINNAKDITGFRRTVSISSFDYVLKKVGVYYNSFYYSGRTYKIRVRENNASGNILAESDAVAFNLNEINGNHLLSFSGENQITLTAGSTYYFESVLVSGSDQQGFRGNYDCSYDLTGQKKITLQSWAGVASNIQLAIRNATGSTETVIYDTDHFVITSVTVGRDSKILKLMSPSTGTDISGAGATPYLDMADNATEVLGTGEEYNLVRLDGEGLIPTSIINAPKQIRNGTTSFGGSSSTAITITTGFRPSVVRVFATAGEYVSFGSWNLIDGNKCCHNQGGGGVSDTVYRLISNTQTTGVIQNITDTGFDIKPAGGASYTLYLFWEAEK